jgi:hypothetical protein
MITKTPQTFAALVIRLGGGGTGVAMPDHTGVRVIFNGWGLWPAMASQGLLERFDANRRIYKDISMCCASRNESRTGGEHPAKIA